ncbi:CPBP family intramembrane glutamic endopeptidase [Hymenobacter sp. PAMC 26628]|uniref:CPBP family intramembrane glutamic endopeptidase n=1 Tax=Hymenobacter sp. PAMC 26628 TaxID=1484118 RepID=UPI0012FFBAEE|nr:CPBP family intramembrane glutamic endopeptidase [Hymenobacter sp. PAMC 26628]
MPGLTEELAFRGVLLALLDRAFAGRVRVLGADMGWGAVASSLVFGLCHGLRVSPDLHVALQLLPMAIPTVGRFVLAWCRARSGSLLLPIFVHSGMNEAAQLVAVAKALL